MLKTFVPISRTQNNFEFFIIFFIFRACIGWWFKINIPKKYQLAIMCVRNMLAIKWNMLFMNSAWLYTLT